MDQTNTASNPSFSIITPTCNRDSQLKRACESVARQTYSEWEHIIVDDGSENPVQKVLQAIYPQNKVQYIRHDERMERVVSYNDGLKAVKNDWICFLDDDDEILPFQLEYLAEAIKLYPETKIFNWGGLVTAKNKGWIRTRDPIEFEEKLEGEVESGQIVNGQFMFHKSCLEKTGLFPEARNCYIFADMAGIPGYNSKVRTLGNPWGQDFYLWYKLTRHYIPKKLDYYLYITHLRTTE
jgi:glycosyltransferase involved in cell wall biosynthesis